MSAGTTLPSVGLPGEVSVRMTVASSRRATRSYAPKNQTLSFARKPPRSAPKSPSFAVFTVEVVVCGRSDAVVLFACRPPPSPKPKTSVWNVLPPDLVMTFRLPPVSRPYSALRPPVCTWTSWMKSAFSVLPSVPVLTPVVFSPSMM